MSIPNLTHGSAKLTVLGTRLTTKEMGMVEIVLNNQRLRLVGERYDNGRLAIVFWGPIGGSPQLTVNMPEMELAEGEFLVRRWPEGSELVDAARASGQFVDTGRRVVSGHLVAEVWTLAPGVTLD